ncbi:putative malate dehydrogenase (decarboxylating) [Helianthus annuus]|nr:putative malate dehydrogenase (decarboxylating) [Helianthus annuus]
MWNSDSPKPAIFAMSNPTLNAECTAADAFKHAGENIVFGSRSPFEHVDLGNVFLQIHVFGYRLIFFPQYVKCSFSCEGNGKVGHVNQANNMYLFPGIGLGSLLSGAHIISDGMLQAASEYLASYMTEEEIQMGRLYPSIDSIRHITAEVGAAVVRVAVAEELAEGHGEVGPKELEHMSKEEMVEYVTSNMWFPIYSPLVHEK